MQMVQFAPSSRTSPATPQAKEGREGDDAPILVVDDTPVSRLLAGGLISRGTGRSVVYAEDGMQALERIAAEAPAAVVTDLQMPEMDGLQLVEAIREKYPRIPVILMTAYGSEQVALRALQAGAASYVPKKSLARELVVTIRQVLELVAGNRTRQRLLACQAARMARYEIENDPSLLPPLIAFLQEDMLAFGIGDDTARMRAGVALQESLANALFHGNLECSSDLRQEDERVFYRQADQRRELEPYRGRRIHVESAVDREGATFVIRDEGPGFNVSSLNKPFDPEDLMRVGGRGMLLIRTFMDDVSHNETGNVITLVKRA